MSDAPSSCVTEFASTRDGLTQLQRRWTVEEPSAAMLVVHGIGEHSGRYLHVGDFFAQRGIDVLAFDNRGFGQSGGRRAYVDRFDQFVDDVEDLMAERTELGVPTILLGHSLGGLIASTYLVSDRPQPTIGVLSAPALTAEVPRWQRVAAPILGRATPKFFLKASIDGSVLSRDAAVAEAYTSDPLLVAGATASLGNEIFKAMDQTSSSLDRLSIPTYVLHGEADELVPPVASEALGQLPNVTRRLWPDLRHECFNEPEQLEVMTEVSDWLRDQLGSSSST